MVKPKEFFYLLYDKGTIGLFYKILSAHTQILTQNLWAYVYIPSSD